MTALAGAAATGTAWLEAGEATATGEAPVAGEAAVAGVEGWGCGATVGVD
jgi:hypothetical protein